MEPFDRAMYRSRVKNKWKSFYDRPYRFSHVSQSNLRDYIKSYSDMGRALAKVLASTDRDLEGFATVQKFYTSGPMSFDPFRAICKRRFDLDPVSIGWKDGWIVPVWQNERWYRDSKWYGVHITHQSENDPAQVAYTRNIDGWKRDIQTRTKPGKYLTQFFSDVLTPAEIKYWAEKQVATASCEGELRFIENDDPDGWVRVYEDGPQSCMKGDDSVRVYAHEGNGLRLAYLVAHDDEIVARAIVRDHYIKSETADLPTIEPVKGDNHGYLRIYPGDNSTSETRWGQALRSKLEEAGYSNQINLDGVRLERIDDGHGVVCPYIDRGAGGSQQCEDRGAYLLCGDGYDATNTNGYLNCNLFECEECGEEVDEEDTTYVESTERRVCQHCLDNEYTYAMGRRYQDYFPNDDVIRCESNDDYYVAEYAEYHDIYECPIKGEWYHIDDLVQCEFGQYEGQYIHVDEAGFDELSQTYGAADDMTNVNGKMIPDEFVGTCVVTGDDLDTRLAVHINVGTRRVPRVWWSEELIEKTHYVYVSADAFTSDEIVDNFVRCGSLLLPNTYFGNPVDCFEPTNVEYGDEYEGEKFEDIMVAYAEQLLEAA